MNWCQTLNTTCIFCGVWAQTSVLNFKRPLWHCTHILNPYTTKYAFLLLLFFVWLRIYFNYDVIIFSDPEPRSVSNYLQSNWLDISLLILLSKKHQNVYSWPFVWGIHGRPSFCSCARVRFWHVASKSCLLAPASRRHPPANSRLDGSLCMYD